MSRNGQEQAPERAKGEGEGGGEGEGSGPLPRRLVVISVLVLHHPKLVTFWSLSLFLETACHRTGPRSSSSSSSSTPTPLCHSQGYNNSRPPTCFLGPTHSHQQLYTRSRLQVIDYNHFRPTTRLLISILPPLITTHHLHPTTSPSASRRTHTET